MRFVFPSGTAASVPDDQHVALVKVAERWNLSDPVEISPLFGSGGAVAVDVGSMVLIVERDGHTHS